VKANDATKLQGDPNPTFTVTYTGFVDNDLPLSLGGGLTFNTNATTDSPVGAYAVTPGGLTSSKYAITFVSGTLNVVPPVVNAYVTDKNIYTPPDYLTFRPPAVGSSYTDSPGFNTPIKRLSDSMHTTDAGTGNPSVVMISTEYSTMSPFNQDNSKLILVHLSYFGLYDGAGNFIRNLPLQINASSEPRWSRSDPNVLYYLQGNQLKQYNVETGATSVVHAFTEYSRISGKFKSDISFDGNHFVFAGDSRDVFVYEISTDSKGAVLNTGGVLFNNVGITPDGKVTIAWIAAGSNRFQGIELFDSNMNFLRQVARSDGHSDFTRDTNGDEVLVWTNSNDPSPIPNCNNGVVKIRLADATQTCLAKFDWSLAVHISGTDNSGWVFVETYAPGDPIPPTGWFTYTDELMQVKLDGSQVRRFAHHRSRPLNSYSYQPKLSISRDGSKLAYASNFGLQQIIGNPTEYSDAYAIDLSVISPDSLGTAYTGP
jgi:MBG domain (YGX type)